MKTKNILIIGFIVLGVALCLAWMISSISSSIKVKNERMLQYDDSMNKRRAETGRNAYLIDVAERGDVEALFTLGLKYFVDNDEKQAVFCFKQAASRGHVEAQRYLGDCYRFGWGVEEDKQQAVYWYEKAARQGDNEALKLLDEARGALIRESVRNRK